MFLVYSDDTSPSRVGATIWNQKTGNRKEKDHGYDSTLKRKNLVRETAFQEEVQI